MGIIGPIRTQLERTTYDPALKRGQMLRVWRLPGNLPFSMRNT
ncbi:hypothetical protein [Synechococcus sp. CBW1108]|nr:hypothetical protein [Synechococcus sp. CBW1108]